MTIAEAEAPFGAILRRWRAHRHLSQLALALKADTSQRHLSFIESGRAKPSRQMVLHLADHLQLPLRERNGLLLAAGYAPVFTERPLDDPALSAVRDAVHLVLRAHEPLPALAIDRHWNMIAANAAVAPLLHGVAESLLRPPVNVLRLSLHPDGLAPRIVNLAEWRGHLLERLRLQIEASADPVLTELLEELTAYPAPRPARSPVDAPGSAAVFVPMQLQTADGVLSFISTTTVFGTPVDVTVSELAIESFFPADAATADRLRAMSAAPPSAE